MHDTFTCNLVELSEVNLGVDLVYRKLQHLDRDTFPEPDMVHSAIPREEASILSKPLSTTSTDSLSRRWKSKAGPHHTSFLREVDTANFQATSR